MTDDEIKIREVIVQNRQLIKELKLQNQKLASLIPERGKRKPVKFPPKPKKGE